MISLPTAASPSSAAASEVDLDTFFDVSLDLLVVRELDGPVVKASASWFSLLGYHPEELVGGLLPSLIHPDDQEATRKAIIEVTNRRPGDPVLGQVNRYRHKDGHYVTLEWRARRFGDRIYGVARDVTQKVADERALVEAKAAAEAANQAKSDFLANMSHEIRTPLNGVIGIVDALSRTELDPLQTEMVALIAASGETLQRLVSDILDVSKIEAGQLRLEARAFDIDEALAAPLDIMRLRAEEKGLEVQRAADVRGVFIGDSTRVRQILTNLISNAVKFTETGSVAVRVALSRAEGDAMLEIEVEDTGVGFDSDHAARLFQRFSQADASITRRFGGTGLGLSISHALAEMMGGHISARSTPGVGSCFSVRLPLGRAADPGALARPAPAATTSDRAQRPLRILLAEDHPTNQRVVQMILAGPQFELVIVEDGARAVAAFGQGRFDLVLMDMQMPVMDGLTATRAIRALEAQRAANAHTPVIMLSANAMAEHRDQARQAGADSHVPKPITAASLLAGIQSVLAD
jgi:PAS domain S-box-containing protein